MKNYIPGAIISLILLIVFFIVDSQIYRNVMPGHFIITFLVMHVVVYKYLIPEKKYGSYLLYVLIFIAAVYFSVPEYTYAQAKAKVENDYSLVDVNVERVPFDTSRSWNPFESSRGYLFSGRNINSDEAVSVLVVPHNGKMFKSGE
ncbi:hypothetical protein [Planococcus sp. CAU13]|uniref:hypothetical protein n=1 Tax=Planococcus sp. CAU13 TaxID=1541197 RepID=UPI00052FFE7A|nr:hypothetical protein [Planococcus sp. CAU13]